MITFLNNITNLNVHSEPNKEVINNKSTSTLITKTHVLESSGTWILTFY